MLIHLTRHSLIYWSFISTLRRCMNFQRSPSKSVPGSASRARPCTRKSVAPTAIYESTPQISCFSGLPRKDKLIFRPRKPRWPYSTARYVIGIDSSLVTSLRLSLSILNKPVRLSFSPPFVFLALFHLLRILLDIGRVPWLKYFLLSMRSACFRSGLRIHELLPSILGHPRERDFLESIRRRITSVRDEISMVIVPLDRRESGIRCSNRAWGLCALEIGCVEGKNFCLFSLWFICRF